ncbi:MAG TPA: hypothetical protein VM658_08635 [bacterium]|nr:hypothetical protein [bacterium]
MDTSRSEELIREHYASLIAAGMRTQNAARHRDRLRFFLHAYLAEEWPRSLDRVDGPIIRDYLGSWFINNVGGSKADLLTHLNTFARFYESLYQAGRISGPEHDEIIAVCAGHDYFMARHDERFAPEPDPWAEFAAGRAMAGAHMFSMLPPGAAPDSGLWVIAKNLERPPAPAILDFSLFLDYLWARPIRLTGAGMIPLPRLRRINQSFTQPERLAPGNAMAHSRRIRWFFNMALALGMARINDGHALQLAPGADAFLDLDQEQKISVLLDGAWNRMRWADLATPENRRVSAWAQEHRDGFAALLADLNPTREWTPDPDPGTGRNEALLARYIMFHEVVQTHILFILRECAILDYGAAPKAENGKERIKSLTITRFGRQVMRLFARRGRRDGMAQQSPLQNLRQTLLSGSPSR